MSILPPVLFALPDHPHRLNHLDTSISPLKVFRHEGNARPRTLKRSLSEMSVNTSILGPPRCAQTLCKSGSPVKMPSTGFYPPPPTFSAHDIDMDLAARKAKKAVTTIPTSYPVTTVKVNTKIIEAPMPSMSLPNVLPDPSDMPPVEDDGQKPAYSYATLIGMAILRAPGRKLTLSAIYSWIASTFSYYHTAESGWQNSIRHNLSLNKAFVKVERPKDEPGKGHYWTVEKGCEFQFIRGRPAKRSTPVPKPISIPKKETKKRGPGDFEITQWHKKALISPTDSLNGRTFCPPASPPLSNERKKPAPQHNDSGYFSPPVLPTDDDLPLFADCSPRSSIYRAEMSYSANALDLILSPPPSSSPQMPEGLNLLPPLTPAPAKRPIIQNSPATSLREHRRQVIQLLASPDGDIFAQELEDDPWMAQSTPKAKEILKTIDSEWDEVAERAAFGSPEKREARRREGRRSLVCGLHAPELYETGFESSNMPGLDIMSIMKREVQRAKRAHGGFGMERSISSAF